MLETITFKRITIHLCQARKSSSIWVHCSLNAMLLYPAVTTSVRRNYFHNFSSRSDLNPGNGKVKQLLVSDDLTLSWTSIYI